MRCSRPGGAGDRPRPGQGVLVAEVGQELLAGVRLLGERRVDHRQRVDVGDLPRLGAVGEHPVGEQHHRGPVGHRDPGRLEGRVEAVAGGLGRHDRDRRLAVAAEHRLQQVGLLGLGRQAGRGAAALDVDHDQRQLGHHREADRLALERDAGAGGGGHAEAAGEGGADRRADAGDLVLGLERGHAERLVLAQLVEDVRGRGDRVGPEEDRQAGLHAAGDQAVGEREVAGDVAVGARRHRRRLDLVADHERLGGLAEVPAAVERGDVGVADRRAPWRSASAGTGSSTRSGRPYIHDSRPSANMFFARAASLRERPNSLTASTVIPVRSTVCRANSARSSFSSGFSA